MVLTFGLDSPQNWTIPKFVVNLLASDTDIEVKGQTLYTFFGHTA